MRAIALISDLGTRDFYIPQVKGYLMGKDDELRLIDITHEVEPNNLLQGAVVLRQTYEAFPENTVFLASIGHFLTSKPPLLASIRNRCLICPDNGLLALVCGEDWEPDWVGTLPASPAQLLHPMREVMAPAALRLLTSEKAEEIAPKATSITDLAMPRPILEQSAITGEILFIDRYGNAISNISNYDLARLGRPEALRVRVNREEIEGISQHPSDMPEGEIVAYVGSHGLLEIAIYLGKAKGLLGLAVGQPVRIDLLEARA